VFRINKPTAAAIEEEVAAASSLSPSSPRFMSAETGRITPGLPFLFAHDFSTSTIGRGPAAFTSAKRALAGWTMFDLGWIRVANATAPIAVGQTVAVEARTLGLWTLNLSRIVDVVDTDRCFGFVYATTALHVERGEERFLVEWDPESGEVTYTLEAVSRPQNSLALLGLPVTRGFQHRFARESHERMKAQIES